MARETRRRLLALHGRFIAGGALLALLITLVDQGLGIGKGGWFSFENLLTYLAWSAFVIDATLATTLVLVLARAKEHVIIINLLLPFVLLFSGLAYVTPKPQSTVLQFEEAKAAAARCLGGLTSWSWTEPDAMSASAHLELTMPASNTVEITAWADTDGDVQVLAQYRDIKLLPAGRSTLDLKLWRFQPGRPESWSFYFKCDDPMLEIGYSNGLDYHVQVQRPLTPATSSASERAFTDQEYDLFSWRRDTFDPIADTRFLIRRASHLPLDKQVGENTRRPMQELPAQLAALKGASVTWWMAPEEPNSQEGPRPAEVRAVQNRFDAAGVHLILSHYIVPPDPPSADASGAAGAADD